jgi:phenylacetate-CoA ligase
MIAGLYRDVLIPGFESGLKRRGTFRYWRDLERTQWLPEAEVAAIQLAALQRLVRHAWDNCPYYRREWEARGLDPASLRSLDDFRRWPIIDRHRVRENRMAMRATGNVPPIFAKSTGGSTGDPLQFDLDTTSNDRRMAAWHRGYSWAGAGPGVKQVHLWGTTFEALPWWRRVKQSLYDRLYRRKILSSFRLSEKTALDYFAEIQRVRPEAIVAYTNPLYDLARIFRERGLVPHSPRTIVVGAEALHDFQRQLIEDVFRAPVFETYGSREFMLLAAECDRHDGLHVNAEQILLEVLDDDGRPAAPGAEGQVVITDLYNYGMPFVRYANGDRAVAGFGSCSCGRGLPVLRRVLGRQLDVLSTPDGRRVAGEMFPHLLKDFPTVRRFQAVQESEDSIVLRLVLSEDTEGVLERIEAAVRGVVGDVVRFRLETVDEIPLTATGKQHVVVNRIASRPS